MGYQLTRWLSKILFRLVIGPAPHVVSHDSEKYLGKADLRYHLVGQVDEDKWWRCTHCDCQVPAECYTGFWHSLGV
jgi:hypothetical protein